MNGKIAKKVEKVQELVQEDVTNGKQVQKKLRLRLEKNGFCPETIAEELKSYKNGG